MLDLSHKKLEVYKSSLLLIKEIYNLTTQLPSDEKYGLKSQLKRASLSVSSNIAEGASRKSLVERKRFYEISRSSLVEIDTQIEALLILEFITVPELVNVEPLITSVFKMICGLINKS